MILNFSVDLSGHLDCPMEIAKIDGQLSIKCSPELEVFSRDFFNNHGEELNNRLFDDSYLIGSFHDDTFYMHYGGTILEDRSGIELNGYKVYDTLSRCFRGSTMPFFMGLVGTGRDGEIFLSSSRDILYYTSHAREALTF